MLAIGNMDGNKTSHINKNSLISYLAFESVCYNIFAVVYGNVLLRINNTYSCSGYCSLLLMNIEKSTQKKGIPIPANVCEVLFLRANYFVSSKNFTIVFKVYFSCNISMIAITACGIFNPLIYTTNFFSMGLFYFKHCTSYLKCILYNKGFFHL